MELYFSEGGDLTSRDVLVQAAIDCGLDGDEVLRKLSTEEDAAEVEAEANSAKEAGIDGVPWFIFAGACWHKRRARAGFSRPGDRARRSGSGEARGGGRVAAFNSIAHPAASLEPLLKVIVSITNDDTDHGYMVPASAV